MITLPGYVKPDDFHSDFSVQKRDKFEEGSDIRFASGTFAVLR
jgi:hypothetical protein